MLGIAEDWNTRAKRELANFARCRAGHLSTADSARLHVENTVGVPAHPNKWGGLFRWALNQHILTRTGRFLKSTRLGNNSRLIPEYSSSAAKADLFLRA